MLLETIFIAILFIFYVALWKLKRAQQIKATGKDPEIMEKSESGLQKYINRFFEILVIYTVAIIVLHAIDFQIGSLFSRIDFFGKAFFDILGFALGISGLSLCAYAQIKMGNSWRVGIDEKIKTELITTGIYKFIRNPTYLGLFILNFGIWLIWPTWAVFLFNFIFVFILDIQVRCEEDFLLKMHGEKYFEYKSTTKRYIPFIY